MQKKPATFDVKWLFHKGKQDELLNIDVNMINNCQLIFYSTIIMTFSDRVTLMITIAIYILSKLCVCKQYCKKKLFHKRKRQEASSKKINEYPGRSGGHQKCCTSSGPLLNLQCTLEVRTYSGPILDLFTTTLSPPKEV